ncbi:hypothetical protein WJX75_002087 [Coccomyxa subellipsoidea]|uniref:ditrans,polycis-polyprenyl diphosphate synthase [(2E,6E)-farnesyldiphosphate specific] n=1 Tax=Coccomyxa subellipsoidea TaxID=248742 RepID=A0ABR2YVQ4_9CHLO
MLLLLQAVFLGEDWLRTRAIGARHRCQQVISSILDAVPYPFNLPLDWLLPQQKPTTGKVPGPPSTIALVLAEADLTKSAHHRVADVIGWCAQNGLTHISIYDPNGHVKAQRSELAQSVSRESKIASSYTFSIEAGYPMLAKAGNMPPSLGVKSEEANGTEMDDYSPRSCQSTEDLLNAFTKDLEAADKPQPQTKAAISLRASAQKAKQLLTPAELDAQMASLAGPAAVREPDLVLVFGRTFSLAGYPPWSIRFSEIYHMGELTDFTRRKLTDALQRYCKTPQRFGT